MSKRQAFFTRGSGSCRDGFFVSYECSSSSSDSEGENEAERRLKIREMGKNRLLANAF